MHNDYYCEVLRPKSHRIDLKLQDSEAADEKTYNASTVIEMKLRNLMTHGEMEILTTWFPKAAQTLASVLRNRSH
jgi:hypothetical protein